MSLQQEIDGLDWENPTCERSIVKHLNQWTQKSSQTTHLYFTL